MLAKTLAAVWLLLWGLAAAQELRDIQLEFGFANNIVANAWNPVQLRMRNQPAAELIIDIDQGSLLEGEQWLQYRRQLQGGSGLYIFEDVLYIPAWRSFTWTVRSNDVTLASGSVDRRRVDSRPLTLLSANDLGLYRELEPLDVRIVRLQNLQFLERSAAYDAVRHIILDGSSPPPRPQALVAAAAGGVHIALIEPLPESFAALRNVAASPEQRLAAGWFVRGSREDVLAGLLRLAPSTVTRHQLEQTLNSADLAYRPSNIGQWIMLAIAAAYAALLLLLLRFGSLPGLFTSLVLALLCSAVAWLSLRPADTLVMRTRSLHLGAGNLAQVLELRSVFSLPAQEVNLPVAAFSLDSHGWRNQASSYDNSSMALIMGRWSTLTLALRPRLDSARLQWREGQLYNASNSALHDIYIIGQGWQGERSLEADNTLAPSSSDSDHVPYRYHGLLSQFPAGTALARQGEQIHLAFAEP